MMDFINKVKVSTILLLIFGVLLLWSLIETIWDKVAPMTDMGVGPFTSITAIILFGIAIGVYVKGIAGNWGKKSPGAIFAYKTTVGVLFITAVLLFFFGEQWLYNPLLKDKFDIRTGEPLYMVYDVGDRVVPAFNDRRLLRPEDCSEKPCFNPADNEQRMRPVGPNDDVEAPSLRSGALALWSLVWGDSGEEGNGGSGAQCPQYIDLKHLKPGGDQEICMEAGRRYILVLGHRMGNRVRLRFDDAPLRVRREFELFPEDLNELVDIGYYGGNSPLSVGLVTDSIRLQANGIGYRKYLLSEHPVYFEVYIE